MQPKDLLGHVEEEPESSEVIRERVIEAQMRQLHRNNALNAHMNEEQLSSSCRMNDAVKTILEQAMQLQRFSGRAINRLLSVARTIADMSGVDEIGESHVLEALSYRAVS